MLEEEKVEAVANEAVAEDNKEAAPKEAKENKGPRGPRGDRRGNRGDKRAPRDRKDEPKEFEERVVFINRVSKTVKGGNSLHLSSSVTTRVDMALH